MSPTGDAPTDDPGTSPRDDQFDHDVVIVGGGPSGASAAVFTARDDLDTVVYDRGNAALRRAAFVENYLGFPAGIDVDSLYDRMHDHVEEAGAEYIADMVTNITRPTGTDERASSPDSVDEQPGFVVEIQDSDPVTTRCVIAAAWYDGDYLRPLVGDDAFEVHDHGDGDEHEHFDAEYPDSNGHTPISGLYVAAPNGQHNAQAIIAAGHGAQVARTLIRDLRRAAGYPGMLADPYDWLRRREELEGEWLERDRWRDWFHDTLPADHALDDERLEELREQYIDRAFETIRTGEKREELREQAHDRLLDYIDNDQILERAREIERHRQEVTET